MAPAQRRVRIGQLLFSSDFDGGNMGNVEKAAARRCSARGASPSRGRPAPRWWDAGAASDMEAYAVNVVPDCAGTSYVNDHRTWFYFGVQLLDAGAVRAAEAAEAAAGTAAAAGEGAAAATPRAGATARGPAGGAETGGARRRAPPRGEAGEDDGAASTSAEGDDDREDGPDGLAGDALPPGGPPRAASPLERDAAGPRPQRQGPPPAAGGEAEERDVRLAVLNMNNQAKLYRQGYRPWFRTLPHQPRWRRLPADRGTDFAFASCGDPREDGQGFCVRWNHRLSADGSTTFFAFCVPFGYDDCQELLALLDGSVVRPPGAGAGTGGCCEESTLDAAAPLQMLSGALQESWVPRAGSAVYFHRQELDRSLEERAVDLLTITAAPRRGEPRQLERYPPDLPLRGEPPRHFPGRPVAFFSARVHPGETPGQFALLGALRLLLSEDPRAAALREAFVFKVVPMLNPDGVARGHYRTNSRGLNLNRHYDAPVRAEHEAVWSVRRLLEYWAETRGERERLLLYVDFHAHATKQGCFFLANRLEGAGQAWNMGYARACQVNSPHFDITACEFAAAGVKEEKKDKDGLGKEGSGRVAIYKCCRLCHAYTLECNYNSGKYVNHTYAPSAAGLPSWAESPGAAAGREAVVPYGAGCWANIGEALCVSLLDMYGHNCCSRLPGSKYGSLVRLVGASHLLGQTPASTARKAPAEILPLALAQLTLDAASEREACCQRGPQCCWGAGPAPGGGSAAARRQSWSGRCRGRGSPCAASVRTVVGRGAQRLQLGTPRQPGLPSRSPSPRRPPPARSPRQGRPPHPGRPPALPAAPPPAALGAAAVPPAPLLAVGGARQGRRTDSAPLPRRRSNSLSSKLGQAGERARRACAGSPLLAGSQATGADAARALAASPRAAPACSSSPALPGRPARGGSAGLRRGCLHAAGASVLLHDGPPSP